MKVIVVYARLYAKCVTGALKAIRVAPWTLLLPVAALSAYFLGTLLLGTLLGRAGGFGVAFLQAGLLSAYFYFVGEGVGGSKVGLSELGKSLKTYFWSFLNLAFVYWIGQLLVTFVTHDNPPAGLNLILELLTFVLLNAAPEVIVFRGTYGGIATIETSTGFIQENWIEWFVPNILVGLLLFFALPFARDLAFRGVGGMAGALPVGLLSVVGVSAVLHFAALFRGFLFQELYGGTHRQRMYKYRST